MSVYTLKPSDKSNKRLMVITPNDKKIHFGSARKLLSEGTFLDHKDKQKKENWIKRHRVRGTFDDPSSASFWAYHLLWNKPTLSKSIRNTERKYNINIKI